VDVVARGPKICAVLSIHGDGFIAALEQMASELVFHVMTNRVGRLQLLHSYRQVGPRGLHQQVVMIFHEHVRVYAPPRALARLSQRLQKQFAILIVQVNGFQPITSVHDMVNSSFIFNSGLSRHFTNCL